MGKYLVLSAVQGRGPGLEETAAAQGERQCGTREERFIATAPNQAWSIDFVADQLQDGRRFRALTIIDVYPRESVAIENRSETERRRCGASVEPSKTAP